MGRSGYDDGVRLAGSIFVIGVISILAWPAQAESDFWEEMANPGIRAYRESLTAGLELINAGDYVGATALLTEAVASMPDEAPAHAWLAYVLSRTGRHEEAVPVWERARVLDEELFDEERLSLEYANCLAQLGRFQEAAEVHGRMLARGVSSRYRSSVLITMGDLLVAASCDGVDEAIELFQDAVRDYPDDAGGHWRLAAALHRAGRPEEGETELAVALRLDPQWGTFAQSGFVMYPAYEVHFFRALGWEHLGHESQARNEWRLYLEAGGAEGCWADLARAHQRELGRDGAGRARR